MCDKKREIIQLWEVAKYYFQLVKIETLDNKMPELDLILLVNEWTVICKNPSKLKSKMNFLYFTANIDSCAIRLHSIDEILESERHKLYCNYWSMSNKVSTKMKEEFENDSKIVIHYLLRNITAHAENLKNTESYNMMKKCLNEISFKDIIKYLENIMNNIKDDCNVKYGKGFLI